MTRWTKHPLTVGLHTVPNKPGVYAIYSSKRTLLYIGQSVDVKSRLYEHMNNNRSIGVDCYAKVKASKVIGDWLQLEYRLIAKLTPPWNKMVASWKDLRHPFVAKPAHTPFGPSVVALAQKLSTTMTATSLAKYFNSSNLYRNGKKWTPSSMAALLRQPTSSTYRIQVQ